MSKLITLEEHVNDIYNEAARIVLNFTPQVFIFKDIYAQTIESHASCVLIKLRQTYYLATAAHVISQNDELIKIGVLDINNHLRLISGDVVMQKGSNYEIDIALVKLTQESTKILLQAYKFLDFSKLRPTLNIPDEMDYLIVGHPISKTNIDNKKRVIRPEPFVHSGKSAPASLYPKLNINKTTTTLIRFDKRRSTFLGSNEMSMAPNPKGISGCGLWYIQSHEIADPTLADLYLMGIMIEHDSQNRVLLGTKSEELSILFVESINRFGNI